MNLLSGTRSPGSPGSADPPGVFERPDLDPIEPVASPDRAEPASLPSATRWAVPALLLLPVVVLLVLGASPYHRLNNGDPFVYAGYAADFRGHIERFGYTYHGVRFGLIFPLRVSLALGPVWGYLVLRYLLYLLAIGPLYAMLRRWGTSTALGGAALFVANPVTAQAILTTHPDTIVVPCVTALVCILVLSRRQRGWRLHAGGFVAGLLGGVAVNADVFAAPLVGLLMAVFCLTLLGERRPADAVRSGTLATLGVALVSLFGAFVYWRLFGDANIFRTTFNAISDIKASSIWRSPDLTWLSTRRYAFAPPVIALFGIAALLRRRRAAAGDLAERLLVVAFLVVGLGYFVLDQFVLGGTSIEMAYYYSYLIGPGCLVLAAGAAWLGVGARSRRHGRAPPARRAAAVVALPVVVALAAQLIELRPFVSFVAVLAVGCVAIVGAGGRVAALSALIVVNLAWGASPRVVEPIAGAGFQYEPHYETAFGGADDTAFEAYLLASEVPSRVPDEPGVLRPMLFWYPSGDALLDAVGAGYHWESLALQRSPAPGLPELSAEDLVRLRSTIGGYLVLMARTGPELERGLERLAERSVVVGPPAEPTTIEAGDSHVVLQPVAVISAGP